MLRTIPAGIEVAKSIRPPAKASIPPPPGPPAVVPGSSQGAGLIVAACGILGVIIAGALVAGFSLTGHPDPPQPFLGVLRLAPEDSERPARFAEEKRLAEIQAEQAKAVALPQAEAERAEATRADVERPPEE